MPRMWIRGVVVGLWGRTVLIRDRNIAQRRVGGSLQLCLAHYACEQQWPMRVGTPACTMYHDMSMMKTVLGKVPS